MRSGSAADTLEIELATARARALFAERAIEIEPELLLVPVLRLLLDVQVAVDVGSYRGDYTYAFAEGGLHVWAYDASPRMAYALKKRMAGWPFVHVTCCALHDRDGVAALHLVEMSSAFSENSELFSSLSPHATGDVGRFGRKLSVPCRRLSTLQAAGLAPDRIGFLKVDTEGEDLSVLAGIDRLDADIVQVEFWGESHVFNQGATKNSPVDYQSFFSARGYQSMLMFVRTEDSSGFRVQLNDYKYNLSGWGNILFFKERSMAMKAAQVCVDVFGPTMMGA